jgi:hypothetical protein
MSTIQRIYEINERMTMHRIDSKEPLVINTCEIDEIAEYIFTSLRDSSKYSLPYLKESMRAGKVKLFGRTVHVLP